MMTPHEAASEAISADKRARAETQVLADRRYTSPRARLRDRLQPTGRGFGVLVEVVRIETGRGVVLEGQVLRVIDERDPHLCEHDWIAVNDMMDPDTTAICRKCQERWSRLEQMQHRAAR